MGWQEIYHSAEDKWYAMLDSLDQKNIPVYHVIDPIDKVVPSLLVAGVLLLGVLGLFILPLIGIGGGSDVVLSFTDTQGRAISGLSADITIGNESTTRVTNSVGKIVLKGVNTGADILVQVDDVQYQTLSTKEKVSERNQTLSFTLTPRRVVPALLTFQFVDGGNQSLSGKTLFVSLACASGAPLEQAQYTITNGILTLNTSEECGTYVGTISGNGIQTKDGVLFTSANAIISLSTLSTEKGKAKITVRSADDDAVLENMDVELISAQGNSIQTITTNSFGVAIFNDVPVGDYYASVNDGAGEYALSTTGTFSLSANQTTPVDVSLSKQVQGTLRISVTAKTGNTWIANAIVKLIRKSDNKLLASKTTTTENTPITLDVSERGPFLLTASHTDYLSETKEIPAVSGEQTVAFALEKLTAQNSGRIVVNVVDEDNLNVDNAHVMLYDAASGFLYHAANPAITDSNGNAKFMGVPSGNYFARATKYPAGPSDSPAFQTDKSIAAQTKLTLTIGQAAVQAIVKDVDGNPVPFATVEFLTDGTDECLANKCAVQTDALGVVSRSFKADRKVYVRARAAGFTTYSSASYQLYPAQTRVIEVKLPKTILGQTPRISFVDVRDPVTNARATDMKSGKTYLAVFQLQVPSALQSLNGGGIMLRVGREELIENDILAITGINAPGAVVVKGTSYQPGINFEDGDELNLTNGNAKWATLRWNTMVPGVYEVSALVRVSEEASNLDELPFYYRAWVEDGSTYLRDPADVTLGTSQTSALKEGQYAESYQKIYFNGKSIVCDDTFCYSGESILNEDDQLLVEESPYDLSINKRYTYSFVLTSNATTVYQAPKLRVFVSNDAVVASQEVQLNDYTVTRPDGQELQGSNLSTYEIPGGGEGNGLDVGRLEQFKTIVGEFTFTAKQNAATNVVVQLINQGEIVFEQVVPFSIASSKQILLSVDPTTAAAFIPTTFNVRVRDSEGFEIQDALVSLLKIDPNQIQQIIARQYTDITGRTTLNAPPSLPNTRFVIDAVKGGYASDPVRIVVDENVATFTPVQLTFNLPNSPNTEQFLPLDITNQTQQGIIISRATITGDFQGLLSTGEMRNYVEQYQNTTSISSLDTETIQVKASTSASVSLVANKTLKGDLVLTFKNTQSNQEWVQLVPLQINVRVIGDCDEEAIQLSGTPASGTLATTAFDNRSQTPFQISNICTVEGQPYQMRNLKAKVVWKSNPIGNAELAVTDIEGSEQAQEVLRSSTYTTLFDTFKSAEESTYESILTFTPFPQNIGQTADFTVTIAGEIGSGTNARTVAKSFDVKIKVTNLETCVTFNPEPEEEIVLKSDEDDVEFEIDTSACGNVPVDIFFCTGSNNSNCSGGAPEGRLFLSQYSINNLSGTKTIKINRQGGTLPGSYDLTVDASVPGVSPYRIASLNVKVESDSSYAFEMEKSDFTLYQKNAKDATTIINSLVTEKVSVKADECDWGKAADHLTNGDYATAVGVGAGVYLATAYYAASVAGTVVVASATGTATLTGWAAVSDGCIPCIVVAVVAVIVYLVIEEANQCTDDITAFLPDYIINLAGGANLSKLPPDAINILLSNNASTHVKGEWNTTSSNYTVVDAQNYVMTQTVGAVFTNMTGYTNPNPLFAVATLRATEHIHGDEGHGGNAKVECNDSTFGMFRVGPGSEQGSCSPAYNKVREEKFHVKFRTQDVNQTLPKLNFDSVACVSGTTLGATGNGSVPQVAFNWSWSDTTGIPMYACDASNPNAIYCDATQLNIDIMKRIKALDDFLAANQYTFDCPTNPAAQPDNAQFPAQQTMQSGFIGLIASGYDFQTPTSILYNGKIENKTITPQNGTLTIEMTPLTGTDTSIKTCTANTSVPAGGTSDVSCTISNLPAQKYSTRWTLTSNTTTSISFSQLTVPFDIESYGQVSKGTCEDLLKTTAILNGVPGINMWIDAGDPRFAENVNDTSVTYTPAVPNVQVLNQLMHFDAYLIRDGYSKDFENDFRDYYSTQAFADAPVWFKGTPTSPGLNRFYGDDDALVFSNKYFNDTTLPNAGKYRVDISVFFGDDWRLLDANGSLNSTIGVDFYHIKNPVPNSPFYRLPFNGQVGLVGTQYNRVGYGLEFINETNPIKVNDSLVKTFSGEESSAIAQANVEYENDLRVMNSVPSTRGNILEITASSGNAPARIVFTPSLATPTVLKVTKTAGTQPFSAFYHIAENGSPIETGSALTYWEGAGTCYDFTSVPVYERFNYSPDRAANNTDRLNAWQYAYGVDWPFARQGGDEYLRTIFYTPAQGSYSIVSETDYAKFFTANAASPSTSQSLDGVSTMPYNNASTVMDSLQDVFDLVSDGKICVTDSGNKARFYWNPETVYKQTSQTSISAFTNGLVAGQTCVGPPVNG